MRRTGATLAVIALLFHSLLPLPHAPGALAGTSVEGGIVLCTAQGIRIVSPADLAPAPGEPHKPLPLSGSLCPFCIAAHTGGGLLPPVVAVPVPPPIAGISLIGEHREAPDVKVAFASSQPRAPPAIV